MLHEILHDKENSLSKQTKEIQAEGTAYVVSKFLKIKAKSFNYLALYDADCNKIMENLEAIARASKQIISFLNKSNPVNSK